VTDTDAAVTIGSPYRGLAAFGESDLDGLLFFGRERETEVTTANLLASRLTVLYGPSGVGKSSLLRAGVARRVRELGERRAIGRGPDLACVVFGSWADEPERRLAEAIADVVRPLVSPTVLDPPANARLADVAEHWSGVLDGNLCIVLDQLEEYFVYHEHTSGPESLVAQLPDLVTRPGLRANVLLAVRDDELARLGVLKNRIPNVFGNARRLDRLDRPSARAAILGPLQRRNELEAMSDPVEIEDELVEAVLDQTTVAAQPGRVEAPYLQLVMQRIWEAEVAEGSRLLRLGTLHGLGGAEAIVREHLDRALSALDPGQQGAAARMFEHLVTPSGTKIAHRASDLAAFAHVDVAEGHDVLETLGRERILRPLDDDGAGGRYEIFHDVLAQAVLEWGRRRDVLAERSLAKRRQRRLLALAAAALFAVVVMIAVTAYALGQRGDARAQARHAGASALAADALAALPTDPQRGLLLADQAARREPTVETEQVLRSALMAARGRAVLHGNVGGVLAVGFAGGKAISIDGSGTLRTFPLRSGGPSASRPLGGRVRAAAISSGGAALVVARRRLVEVRNLRTPHLSFAFRAPAPVRAVAVDAHGDRVAVATLDGRLIVRDARGPILNTHIGFATTSLALDDRGLTVAAAGGHAAWAWRVQKGRVLARVTERADVTGVALAPDGGLLATAVADGAARLRLLPGGAIATVLVTSGALTGVEFSPDGTVVVTRDREGTARTFAVDGGRPVAVLAGHTDAVTAAAFSVDGRRLVTGSADGTARIWDPGVAPELQLVARPPGCCTALVTGPAGTLVAAGGRALLYRNGKLADTYRYGSRVTAVAFAGETVVIASADGRVRTPTLSLSAGAPVTAVTATPSFIVAAVRGGEVEVWSRAGRKLLALREPATVNGVAVSPNGRLLATAGADDIARIHDLATGKLLHKLVGHTKPVTAVAFSPDGTIVATSSVDHDVRLWDATTGRLEQLLRAHFAVVSDVAFSPDGRWLVTAGPTTAGLWRMPGGTFLTYLRGHTARLVGAGFTADGTTVETASVDGTVRADRCDVCGSLQELLRLAGARLAAVPARPSG
jgi:WD40 repeat protein